MRCCSGVIAIPCSSRRAGAAGRWLVASATVALTISAAGPAAAAVRRTPALAPNNSVIDGPSANLVGLTGMVVARDGTGGVIYLKQVGGVNHVFVSLLLGGSFQAPQQIDAGLSGSSSQPVLAGTTGGLMVAAFINGGELYVVHKPSAAGSWSAPQPLQGGASNPDLSMSFYGKAYLAFASPGGGGHDVRVAYYNADRWQLVSAPLDANPADDAGSGTGRPDVVAAGDGTGIVVWGENGHIFSRRVRYTSPSISVYQADPSSFGGWSEVSASDPVIGGGGDSSYAAVLFRETLTNGSSEQTRVIYNRLHSNRYDATRGIDGLSTPGAGDADQPAAAPTESGTGFLTAEQASSHNLFATSMGTNDLATGPMQVNSLPEVSAPDAVPAPAGTVSTLIAWQQDQGGGSFPEIRLRYAPDGNDLGPEQVLSSTSLGPTDASLGLTAGGDLAGDAAVAWVQGSGAQTRIVAAQLYQGPGSFSPSRLFGYATSVHPLLRWSPAAELWRPLRYVVRMNGQTVAQTSATTVRVPATLGQGRHGWQVIAVNAAGEQTPSKAATVFVDSLKPRATIAITGPRRVGSVLHVRVRPTDLRPGLARSKASGVSSVQLRWGDGSKLSVGRLSSHRYRRGGRFVLRVTVKDRAGNRLVLTRKLRILGGGAAKPKKHGKA